MYVSLKKSEEGEEKEKGKKRDHGRRSNGDFGGIIKKSREGE